MCRWLVADRIGELPNRAILCSHSYAENVAVAQISCCGAPLACAHLQGCSCVFLTVGEALPLALLEETGER